MHQANCKLQTGNLPLFSYLIIKRYRVLYPGDCVQLKALLLIPLPTLEIWITIMDRGITSTGAQ